eukprot:11921462-Ditylum_brightwellii.AAC.1
MFDTKFEGCNYYKVDAEGLLDVGRQLFNHTNATCPFLHPENIKVQDIKEPLVQACAKNHPCVADPNKGFKRKGPRHAMIHKPTTQNANVDKHVSFKEDLHQDLSDDADFQSDVEDEEELEEEEESEHEDITSTSDKKHEEGSEDNNISDDNSHFPHPSCKTLD